MEGRWRNAETWEYQLYLSRCLTATPLIATIIHSDPTELSEGNLMGGKKKKKKCSQNSGSKKNKGEREGKPLRAEK